MNVLAALSKASKKINEKHFGVHFVAIGPTGERQDTDAFTGNPLKTMQIMYNSLDSDVETGADIIVRNPNITIANNSLDPFPKAGENWLFQLPESPLEGAAMKDYMLSPDREYPEGVLGVTTLFFVEVSQSDAV